MKFWRKWIRLMNLMRKKPFGTDALKNRERLSIRSDSESTTTTSQTRHRVHRLRRVRRAQISGSPRKLGYSRLAFPLIETSSDRLYEQFCAQNCQTNSTPSRRVMQEALGADSPLRLSRSLRPCTNSQLSIPVSD